MDARKWTIETGYDWERDRADGVVLACSNCASVGTFEIEGETLAHVIDQATQHDRIIHER